MSRLLIAIALLAALLAGCGKKATEPPVLSGGSGLPPSLKATQPVARATRVPYDGEIWGEFDRPLDSRTVRINGREARIGKNGAFPRLAPHRSGGAISLPGHSISFFAVRGVSNPACAK